MDSNVRLDKAAQLIKQLEQRIKDLEERQTALENTMFQERTITIRGVWAIGDREEAMKRRRKIELPDTKVKG